MRYQNAEQWGGCKGNCKQCGQGPDHYYDDEAKEARFHLLRASFH